MGQDLDAWSLYPVCSMGGVHRGGGRENKNKKYVIMVIHVMGYKYS